MSNTESGRLAALQATVRACSVVAAIDTLRSQRQCIRPPAPLRPVGNSESGRLANMQAAFAMSTAPTTGTTTICPRDILPATRTIQSQGAYLASKQAICALNAGIQNNNGNGLVNNGGKTESQRIRAQQSELLNVDFTVNPDARFLQYERFFPEAIPPGPLANNMPIARPRFPICSIIPTS